jgi:hypothetical protein
MQPSIARQYADIDDFAYLATSVEIDTRAIYTTDPHLAAMGAPVVSVLIDTHLRDYARAKTVQIAVNIGSSLSFMVGWKFIQVIYKLLVRCIKGVRQLPPAVQIALVAAGIICIAHPKSRARLKEGWNALVTSEALLTFGDIIADFAAQVANSAEKAETSYQIVETTLPPRQKHSLLMHARAVCLAASTPLSLAEMDRQIRLGGYVSRSRTFRRYLRQVLQADGGFMEIRSGYWTILGAKASG